MLDGERSESPDTLETIRTRSREEFEQLDDGYKTITNPEPFPVGLNMGLRRLQEQVVQEVKEKELGES